MVEQWSDDDAGTVDSPSEHADLIGTVEAIDSNVRREGVGRGSWSAGSGPFGDDAR